jgi:hypothetical protein
MQLRLGLRVGFCWPLLMLFALGAGRLQAQGGAWPTLTDAGIEYLSSTGFLQVSFSGQLDLEAMRVGGAGWGGLVKHASGTETPTQNWVQCTFCHQGLEYAGRPGNVMAPRLRLFTDIFLGDHVYSLIEVRGDLGHAPTNRAPRARIEQAFVRLSTNGGLGVQAGQFASPFGSYALRHLTVVDPFLRPPLPYDYRTVLVRKFVPKGDVGVVSWRDWPTIFRAPGAPPVWDVPYQVGAMVFGRLGPVDLRAAAMGSAPSSDPVQWGWDPDNFRRPSWVFAARSKLGPAMEVGGSYSKGPWMQPPYGGTVPSPRTWRDFDQEIMSADIAFSRGPMMFRAEALFDQWALPGLTKRLKDLSYTAELQYDLRAGLSAAARVGMIDFRPFRERPDGPAIDWDHDVYRLEASLGYRLVRNAGVLVSAYQQNVKDSDSTWLGGVRLWYAF